MTTFVLKKYVPQEEELQDHEKKTQIEEQKSEPEKKLSIQVSGSVSEIVAKALHRVLPQNVTLETTEDEAEEEVVVQAISREDILEKPLDTYRSISKDGVLFIASEGFKGTRHEEWFLFNINENKKSKVFYTAESFANHLVSELMKSETIATEGLYSELDIKIQEEVATLLENVTSEMTLHEGDVVDIVNDKYCDWAPVEGLKVVEVAEDYFVVERENEDRWTVDLDDEITFRPGVDKEHNPVTVVEGFTSLSMSGIYKDLETEELKNKFLTIMKDTFLSQGTSEGTEDEN